MSITKQAIVGASITILNREGIDNLSMRTIAKALDVKAAALYNHVSGKQELLGAVAEHMCTVCTLPEPMDDPLEYLMSMCHAYRVMLLTVRDSTLVFENSHPNTPQRAGIIRLMSDTILQLGVKWENLMTASNMMNNYVLSFVADEIRFRKQSPEATQEFAEMLGMDKRPIFISERGFDEQFDYGLCVLFAGMKAEQSIK